MHVTLIATALACDMPGCERRAVIEISVSALRGNCELCAPCALELFTDLANALSRVVDPTTVKETDP